jgi:hypothetical protein
MQSAGEVHNGFRRRLINAGHRLIQHEAYRLGRQRARD